MVRVGVSANPLVLGWLWVLWEVASDGVLECLMHFRASLSLIVYRRHNGQVLLC